MRRELRYHGTRLFFPILSILFLLYFIYHLIQGEHGWMAWWGIKKQMVQDQEILTNLQKEHEALARRVSLLSTNSLDPDLLDERARAMLNQAAPDEVVVFVNNPNNQNSLNENL